MTEKTVFFFLLGTLAAVKRTVSLIIEFGGCREAKGALEYDGETGRNSNS